MAPTCSLRRTASTGGSGRPAGASADRRQQHPVLQPLPASLGHQRPPLDPARGRLRYYREHADFWRLGDWAAGHAAPDAPVYWAGADDLDPPDPQTGQATQLYKVDAVAYECLMLGLIQVHYGPPNEVCERGGFPKLTELQLGYSRDGFHWDRRDRAIFLGASRRPGHHERGYIHSAGGVCLVVGDRLHFYYGAFSGVSPDRGGAIYAGGSTNLATLRRDGFVSLDAAGGPGWLTTRPVAFSGSALFVNLAAPGGELRAEVLDEAGRPLAPFTLEACAPLAADGTRLRVRWAGDPSLAALAGRPVRFRFRLAGGALYAFWVSADGRGHSNGYVAAGGPGLAARGTRRPAPAEARLRGAPAAARRPPGRSRRGWRRRPRAAPPRRA